MMRRNGRLRDGLGFQRFAGHRRIKGALGQPVRAVTEVAMIEASRDIRDAWAELLRGRLWQLLCLG